MYFKLVSAKKDNEPNLGIPGPDCYKCEGNRCDEVPLQEHEQLIHSQIETQLVTFHQQEL